MAILSFTNNVKLSEKSIKREIITLSIPVTANNAWTNISEMDNIEEGVYAFTFTGIYNASYSWQRDGTYGGIFYWKPNKNCNTDEYSMVPFTYVSHATNNQTLSFRIFMPASSKKVQFQIYFPFTNTVVQTGVLKLRKLL